jgi:hypothetical protein
VYKQVALESTPFVKTTIAATTTDPISKKELEAVRKQESRRLHGPQVKESLAENRDLRICIRTDEAGNITGLKAKWQNVVKDIAYRILDLIIRHWDRHPQHQKEEIYRQVETKFIYDPPLQDGYTEKYLRHHLTSARRKWKEHWLIHADGNRHPNCPPRVWEVLIRYWRSPEGIAECEQMKENGSKVHNPNTCGRLSLSQWMQYKVRSDY